MVERKRVISKKIQSSEQSVVCRVKAVLPFVRGAWCPICHSKLSVRKVDGRAVFVCQRHGEMRAVLDVDPAGPASLAVHCDSLGIVDLEAAC
jgi:hypothetical protein